MSVGLEVLNRAIEAESSAIVSVREGGATHQVSIRLLTEEDRAAEGFWAQIVKGDAKLIEGLLQSHATVEVTFNTENASVFFDSVPLKQRRQWFSRRILLRRPEQLTIVERRKDSREPVPRDIEVPAVLARDGGSVETYCEISARVWDVSPTGASFICRADQPIPKLEVGESLSIILLYNGTEHRLTACHRYTQRLSSSSVRLGVQFNAEEAFDPAALARFREMLEELQGLRIRRSFRKMLRKTFHFSPN